MERLGHRFASMHASSLSSPNGLQPTSDGLQPTSNGIQPSSDGLQIAFQDLFGVLMI